MAALKKKLPEKLPRRKQTHPNSRGLKPTLLNTSELAVGLAKRRGTLETRVANPLRYQI
jgi:hypothetical protein